MADLFTDAEELALAFIREFAATHYEFLGVQVVRRYEGESFEDPSVWRRAAARAVDERIICQAGLTPAGAANPPPAPIWRSLIYRGARPP